MLATISNINSILKAFFKLDPKAPLTKVTDNPIAPPEKVQRYFEYYFAKY